MRGPRMLVVLGALTLVFALAAFFLRQQPAAVPQQGQALFPDLLARINDTAHIAVTSRDSGLTLERRDGHWVVVEKHAYRADREKVQRLLLGTAQLRRIEPKTQDPERYAEIGVQDIDAKDAKSIKISLKDEAGKILAEYLLGESRAAKADPAASEYFVRLAGDPQSWLVEGKVPADSSAVSWLEREILKIDRKRVREVRVHHADGYALVVRRPSPQAEDYELVGLPKGKRIDYPYAVNSIGDTLADLSLDDVRPAAELAFKGARLRVTLVTFDGLRVVMESFKQNGSNLARLQAAFDPPSADADKPATEAMAGLKKPEAVKEEAAMLNARWREWVYVIPQYRVDALAKKMPDLIAGSGKPGA